MQKITAADLSTYKFPAQLKISADGTRAAMVVYTADVKTNSYLGDIYITDLKTKQTKNLTQNGRVSSYDFSDNRSIIFPADLSGEKLPEHVLRTVFNEINVETGAILHAFSLPLPKASAVVLGGGKYLISTYYDNARPCFDELSGAELEHALAKHKESEDYFVCDEHPYFLNGQGYINKKRKRLFVYDRATKALEAVTPPMFETRAIAVSPCGAQVAYAGLEYDKMAGMNSGIYLYDVAKKTTVELLPPNKFNITALDFMDDKIVFPAEDRGADQSNFGSADVYSVGIINHKVTREVRVADTQDMGCVAGCDCRYGGGTFFKVINNTLYFITTYALTSAINAWKPGQAPVRITKSHAFVAVLVAGVNEKLYSVGATGVDLEELFEIDESGCAVQLTNLNTTALADKYVAPTEYISFTNAGGVQIDGWVLRPIGYDAKQKYPAVLDIHGGPRTTFCGGFFHQMQMMASDGCFVMFCNPTGSAGRGDTFADVTGKYGTVDYDDLMQFVDEVLKKYPAIDSQRLGVTGGSYGGYMTNWIVGHTNRFKAAVTQRSISNWVTMYAISDIGPRFSGREQQSTPWDNVEKMWWHSPLKYAKDIKTPTMIIHAMEDYRCPVAEAMQLYTALQLNGVDTRMCLFKGENHELSRSGKPLHRLRRLDEITSWLYRYIAAGE